MMFDAELRGFGVRVGASGNKTFLAQYTSPMGKRRAKLGVFGVVTVEEARRQARVVLGAVAEGRDPVAERAAAAEAMKAAAAAAKQKANRDAFTFHKLAEAWLAGRAGERRASYLREAGACLRRNLPDWQDRPAAEIAVSDAVLAMDRIKADKGTVAANRTLAYARAAFSWAVKRQMLPANPLRGIERPGREAARERVLSISECAAIWRACAALPVIRAAFVRVLLATLQRRDEVAAMRWQELDFDAGLWTLPGSRTKNGKPHVVHLSEPVRAILRSMPKVKDNPFVFSGASEAGNIGFFSGTKNLVIDALAANGDTIPDWRFHDFRRAGVTALADMGFAPHVCDRLLNHITGAIHGVAAVYQRAAFFPERKAALEAWAASVCAAATVGAVADAEGEIHASQAGSVEGMPK
jgi:integrase